MIDYQLETVKFMFSISIIQIMMWLVLDVNEFSLFNFWMVLISQILHFVFGLILVITLPGYDKFDTLLLIYQMYSIFYLVWVVFIIDTIYAEYSGSKFLQKNYTISLPGNCSKITLDASILSKCNKIKPTNYLKTNIVFIKTNLGTNTDCPICYNPPMEKFIQCQQCKNKVCETCKLQLEQLICPVCRTHYV